MHELLRLWGIAGIFDTPELRRNSNQDVIALNFLYSRSSLAVRSFGTSR